MPISAIGMIDRSSGRVSAEIQPGDGSRTVSRGFTLLEVMVVVVLIAIIVSFATLSIDTEPEKLAYEGQRLTALMQLVAEEAIMNSNEYRCLFTLHKYSFERYSEGDWLKLDDGILRPRELAANFRLDLTIENESVVLTDNVDEEQEAAAVILFLSSGEVTPFELNIKTTSGKKFSISNLSGRLETVTTP